jgi:small subunit ribosomal protein S9
MKKVDKELEYIEGIGRRKTSTARVRIYRDNKKIQRINDKDAKDYLTPVKLNNALEPLRVVDLEDSFGFSVKVDGGGTTGQSGAIKLGLARALVKYNPKLKDTLTEEGLLTRDDRMVERKKYFLRKARRAPQYSKR